MKPNILLVLLDNPQVRLEAQYVPDETEYKRTASIAKVMIVGRSNPKQHYTGGESSLSLQFEFCANTFFAKKRNASGEFIDEEEETITTDLLKSEVRKNVYDKTRTAESFTFGDNIKLIFGDMWKDSVWIIENVSVKYADHTSAKYGHLPLRATVGFALSLNPKKSITPEDLR